MARNDNESRSEIQALSAMSPESLRGLIAELNRERKSGTWTSSDNWLLNECHDELERRACKAFASCQNSATTTIPNAILGDVPACDRCSNWFKKMGGK